LTNPQPPLIKKRVKREGGSFVSEAPPSYGLWIYVVNSFWFRVLTGKLQNNFTVGEKECAREA